MNTLNAIKALKESGFDEKQAEKIVEVIADLQNISVATKEDLKTSTDSLKTDLATIKTDLDWIKKLILAVGIAVVIAALKYIFLG
ncbi:hypothetical protein B6440_21670 [Salmonella enterica]|uniref:DUF1640 domain-containing protein n=1 Tax=Salmonella enterica TaxID=28901 RepID=A0A403T7S3_SALER|nr:hypothetical protein [Salmonella enterica]EAZ3130087.1 hypothetical protein [Salmonella enterica]MMS79831.1 hypothetical protein [Salmonella enterica]HAF4830101.1 hypothetical protein [Salmonella enterica]HAV0157076.1 hypothetical protein [Salmonella enterica]